MRYGYFDNEEREYVIDRADVPVSRTNYIGVSNPCVPRDWKGFEVERRWRGVLYKIKVENPSGVSKGVKSVAVNGNPVTGVIPIQAKGSVNDVVVVMG